MTELARKIGLIRSFRRHAKGDTIILVDGSIARESTENKEVPAAMTVLQKVQLIIGILISRTTAIIGWQTYQLSVHTNNTNTHLKQIEQQLAKSKFGFERVRDIYDRTEKYLSSDQDERRGRALVALISSMPDTNIRSALLSIVTIEATKDNVKIAAAESYVGSSLTDVVANGEYFGTISFELLNDGQGIKTTNEFGFKDSKGIVWKVPKGIVVDGASIPQTLWSVVGSPLSGKYRDASIIHDYYTTTNSRSWKSVHRMFYEAMIASGVSETKAKVLYAAVYSAGPRWEITGHQ